MPEVQNVGAVDYAQYQPSQYPAENYAEDYSMQPEVYDESAAQMRTASKSRLGATLLSGAVIAGLALWGGHAWGKKSAAKEIDKAKDAVAKYEEMQKKAEELQKDADNVIDSTFGGFQYGKDFAQKFKNAFKDFFKKAEDVKDETKEGTKKALEDAKDAATELEEKATDANK